MNASLIKKSGIYLVGNLASKVISFVLIPLYAVYILPGDLGYYDYSQTIMNILVPIGLVAIWESILKFLLIEDDEEKREQIISTSSFFVLLMNLGLGIIAIIFNKVLNLDIAYFTLIVLMICINSLCTVWQYYARGLGENRLYTKAGILGVLVNFIIVLVLLVFMKKGIYALYISYIISNLSIILLIERKIKILKRLSFRKIKKSILKEMLIFSIPLVVNLVSSWFITGFGNVIIKENLGIEANGIYSFANKFSIIINTLGTVISMALIEESIIKSKDDDLGAYFTDVIKKLFKLFSSIMILMTPAIVIFYQFIKDTGYYESIKYFPIFLLYALLTTIGTNIGAVFQATNRTKDIFYTTLLGALSTIAITFLTIGKLGIYGVGIGRIIGGIVLVLVRYLIIRRYVDLKLNFGRAGILILLYIIMSTISMRLGLIGNAILILVLCVIIFIFNKEDIINIVKKIKKKLVK